MRQILIFFLFGRIELGKKLYREFLDSKSKITRKIEEEFKVYRKMPDLFPDYEEVYESFALMYKQKYRNHSEEHKERLWMEFWRAKSVNIKNNELSKRLHSLAVELRQKISSPSPQRSSPPSVSEVALQSRWTSNDEEPLSRSGPSSYDGYSQSYTGELTADNDSYMVDKTLTLLETFAPHYGALSQSVLSIVAEARRRGTSTPEALQLFVDQDNIMLLDLALKKLDPRLKELTDKVVVNLLEHAKASSSSSSSSKAKKAIDLEAIAHVTVGEDSVHILNLIRTALALEGVDSSEEVVNELFMNICELHFKIAMLEK